MVREESWCISHCFSVLTASSMVCEPYYNRVTDVKLVYACRLGLFFQGCANQGVWGIRPLAGSMNGAHMAVWEKTPQKPKFFSKIMHK